VQVLCLLGEEKIVEEVEIEVLHPDEDQERSREDP